jgi:two-component system OmpR family response regulator
MTCAEEILVVEDEPDLLSSVATYLAGRGYQVFPAADLATARHHLETRRIALAVLDVGAHGLRLAREAAAQNIPCLLMSGRPVILEMGGLGSVLAKPFRLDALGARVEERLRSYRDAPRLAKGKAEAPSAARPRGVLA